MALLKGSGGAEPWRTRPAAPPPRLLRAPSKPQPRREAQPQWREPSPLRTAGPAPSRVRGPAVLTQPARQPQPQARPFFRSAPPAQAAKPVTVEILPERESVRVQVAPEANPELTPQIGMPGLMDDQWIYGGGQVFSQNPRAQRGGNGREADRQRAITNLEERLNAQARMGQRDIRRREREANDRQETESPLTMDQWNSYSPAQQAVAQWNADLSAAIQRDFDRGTRHSASSEQVKKYQDRVKELFGENGTTGYKGLEYAPNTIAFLDERGIKAADLAGKTLDDFLSGDALVTSEVVDVMEKESKVPRRGKNIAFAQSIAKGQLAYQEKLAQKLQQGAQLLTEITGRTTNAAAGDSYGANTEQSPVELDKVRPELVGQFEKYLVSLADPVMDPETVLETIALDLEQWGAQPEEAEQIWEGLLRQSRQATVGDAEWFPGIGYELRSPVEVAQTLGAPTLKRQTITTAGGQ